MIRPPSIRAMTHKSVTTGKSYKPILNHSNKYKMPEYQLQNINQLRAWILQTPQCNRRHKNKKRNTCCGKPFYISWICSDAVVENP